MASWDSRIRESMFDRGIEPVEFLFMESPLCHHHIDMVIKIMISVWILTFAGCTSSIKETNTPNPQDLTGSWNLESILQDTSGIKKGLSSEWPGISIDYDKKSIYGYSGCNSFGGDFRLRNDSVKLGPITANQKGCLHSVEASFFAQLPRVSRYRIVRDSLEFYAKDTLLLSFSRNTLKEIGKVRMR